MSVTTRPQRDEYDPDLEEPSPDDESFERQPPGGRPDDLFGEHSVLGSMLLSKDAIAEVAEVLKSGDYYRPAHGEIHDAILEMHGRAEPVDPVTLGGELRKLGKLDRLGGLSYLHTLINTVPTAANAEYYANEVREKAVMRRLIEAGTRIVGMGYAAKGDVDAVMAAAVAEVAAAVETRDRADSFQTPGDTLGATFDFIEAAQAKQGGLTGISTGFADLDALTNGLQPGQVIVVAGRPAMGKTTLGMDFARACAIKHRRPAAFVSLEMDIVRELNLRVLSAEARVGLHLLRSGHLEEASWERLKVAGKRYSESPLFVTETTQTFLDIQAQLRRLKNRTPDLALVVIDYLQLIEAGGGKRPETRQQEVSDISRKIKLLAKELEVPIVLIAQLNRGPEQRTDKKPMVSDLRESGAIEQDADMVILLHREDAYERESPRAGEADLIVGKHRNGPTATITVAATLHFSSFSDMTRAVEA
ncbi:replicative DNA helicase (plasmid) [Kitasatospora sp. CMC57]|uniref:Replicative DNA helicase n=1 Tax=Kitasatospora sp. CMC57 TaxID=3231513 RepID=A0AB33K3G8_9ACTN